MRRNRQKGAAIVEFAIVVPLLMLLLFGIIEFGVMLYDKAMLTNASREGARAGVVFQRRTLAEIDAVVRQYAGANLITFGHDPVLAVTTAPADPLAVAEGQLLTVTVNYNYGFLVMPAFLEGLTGGVTLTATSAMRAE